MEHYIEIIAGIRPDAMWFRQLMTTLQPYRVNWQKKFHLTVAFMPEIGHLDDLTYRLGTIRFDEKVRLNKIDTFTGLAGNEHIIALTSTMIPPSLNEKITNLRDLLETELGCRISKPFRFHITLGTVKTSEIPLETLTDAVSKIEMQGFTIRLNRMRLLRFSDHEVIFPNTKLKSI